MYEHFPRYRRGLKANHKQPGAWTDSTNLAQPFKGNDILHSPVFALEEQHVSG
jgi:hypothetical protein